MDQAHNLREFVRKSHQTARVLAVTSGKGGVGKTSTSVNLAIALAAHGKRVIVLDADLGRANVEVLMGLNSFFNLQHVVDGERTIMEILVKGPGGIEIVPGTSGLAKLADLDEAGRTGGTDGVVPYASSHLDGAASELVVRGDHLSMHKEPPAILEVLRILREHAGQGTKDED